MWRLVAGAGAGVLTTLVGLARFRASSFAATEDSTLMVDRFLLPDILFVLAAGAFVVQRALDRTGIWVTASLVASFVFVGDVINLFGSMVGEEGRDEVCRLLQSAGAADQYNNVCWNPDMIVSGAALFLLCAWALLVNMKCRERVYKRSLFVGLLAVLLGWAVFLIGFIRTLRASVVDVSHVQWAHQQLVWLAPGCLVMLSLSIVPTASSTMRKTAVVILAWMLSAAGAVLGLSARIVSDEARHRVCGMPNGFPDKDVYCLGQSFMFIGSIVVVCGGVYLAVFTIFHKLPRRFSQLQLRLPPFLRSKPAELGV